MLEAQNQNDRADDLTDDATETMMRLNAIEAQAEADGELADQVSPCWWQSVIYLYYMA